MTLEESSIFVNLKQLRIKLYSAQFKMTKANRMIYGTPLMQEVGSALAQFVLAFTVKEKRVDYLEEAMGHFTVLRLDLEFCIHEHIIQFKKRKVDKNGQPIPLENKEDMVSTEEIEIFRLVAKIDSDMCRWRASLSKGKTMYGG
jgi:hypothetical protein